METREVFTLGRQQVDHYLSRIAFYKDIEHTDPWQYELILSKTKIYQFAPGEIIWHRGDRGIGFYFVSRGNVLLYNSSVNVSHDRFVKSNASQSQNASQFQNGSQDPKSATNWVGSQAVSQAGSPKGARGYGETTVSPGEIIGDLAMFANNERYSTVIADSASKEIVLVGTDFQRLGLEGGGILNLQTRITLYRLIVNNIRWKIELARMQSPNSSMAKILRKVPIFKGSKGSEDELRCLQAQARVLAKILITWHKIPLLANSTDLDFGDATRSCDTVGALTL